MLEADIPNATDMLQQWSRGIHVQASLRRVFPASVVIDDADCCRANERTTACSLVTRLGNPRPSFCLYRTYSVLGGLRNSKAGQPPITTFKHEQPK